ncbi:hypothetical protein MNBD_CHLOROFLEXI01-807 [hydrothermal vent metagenome]|uniref:Uncharacterized protein n=1 Tax=hydrothermal vent metagenome TaxID=652676 RepID=A0A3B0UUS3_9ZZZZ
MTKRPIVLLLALLIVAGYFMSSLSLKAQEVRKNTENISVNKYIEIRPDIGPYNSHSIIGEYGYKVFHPGAIKNAIVAPLEGNMDSALSVASIRRGATDAWLAWSWALDWRKWGWDHIAYHDSQSDLQEDDIWADGRLKITTDSSWRELCNDHTSGSRADCTNKFFQLLPRTITAETDHHFHKSGFVDDDFMTGDSA